MDDIMMRCGTVYSADHITHASTMNLGNMDLFDHFYPHFSFNFRSSLRAFRRTTYRQPPLLSVGLARLTGYHSNHEKTRRILGRKREQ
jgi:hypothetical protein